MTERKLIYSEREKKEYLCTIFKIGIGWFHLRMLFNIINDHYIWETVQVP